MLKQKTRLSRHSNNNNNNSFPGRPAAPAPDPWACGDEQSQQGFENSTSSAYRPPRQGRLYSGDTYYSAKAKCSDERDHTRLVVQNVAKGNKTFHELSWKENVITYE